MKKEFFAEFKVNGAIKANKDVKSMNEIANAYRIRKTKGLQPNAHSPLLLTFSLHILYLSSSYKFIILSFSIQKRYRINQFIRISPVRVIDEEGQNLGVLETTEALRLAHERDLDLIEIAPTARPPVCKIMDFGKFKYDREKGEREHGKKQKESGIKGIRIGFTTGVHDLTIRAQQVEKFLKDGDKVRVHMRLFGRQKAHGDLAFKKFQEFFNLIAIDFDLEMPPKRTPQGFFAVLIKK